MIPLNSNLMNLHPSGIRRFTALAKELPDCIPLTLGEPDFPTPQPIQAAARRALKAGQTHYAPNRGLPELCRAIAEFETNQGYPIRESQVLITVGATGALFTALMGILNPGDEVVVPIPAFPLYESIITMAGARLVPLPTAANDFQIRKEALSAVLTEKTKAIVINSPNNPTGTVYDAQSLAAVRELVAGRPIYVVCDHVYQQLSPTPIPNLTTEESLRDQLLLCQSFSKPYAMTGWRVGYLAGPETVMGKMVLLGAAQVASVPTFLQTACVTALETPVFLMAEKYAQRRDYVCARLERMGLSFPDPQGAFYVFPDISRFSLSSEEFCARMIREAHVAAVPGSCFGQEGFIRLSCCCEQELLRLAMDRMERFTTTLGGDSQ